MALAKPARRKTMHSTISLYMPRHLLRFLIQYKYQLIFPIAVLEGPIITIISGFLISRGYLSFLPTLIIVFCADMLSDSFFYALGRHARKFVEKIRFLKISENRLKKLESHYEEHPRKTITASKASYGIGALLLVAAGASKMGYNKFVEYITPANAVKSLTLLLIGYYFGKAYRQLGTYLGYYALVVIVALPIVYYFFKKNRQPSLVVIAENPAEKAVSAE